MSSSLPQTATNSQSLNGIITLSDGVITIENGVISGLTELDLINLQVSDTATIENLVVNNQIDMTLGQIKNVSAPTDNGDATNKQYVDTNFVNKTSSTTQSIAGKLSLSNATTDIFTNPIIQFTNTNITPLNQGQFIRFLKGVSQQPNLEIGGLSFCSNNFSTTLRRQADLICSMNSNTYPEINLKFNDGTINPLTINYGNFISRNNKQYFQKQDGTNIFNYLDYLDYVAFAKDISLGTNKIINLASGSNANDAVNKSQLDLKADTTYVDTNFLNKTTSTTQIVNSNLDMNTTNKIINLAEPTLAQDASTKYYTDTHSNNQNYLLRDGSLPMLGDLEMGSNNITIGTNKQLAFNSGDLSTTNGMRMNYDGGVGFFDVRGSEFRIRTASAGTPSDIRFKVNDTNTSVINNFFVDGNTTLGNSVANDTTTFNSIANFPSGSQLKFNSGSTLLFQSGATTTFQSGATTTFATGSYTNFEDGATLQYKSNSSSSYLAGADLEYYNVQSFRTGSYIDGARVRLIKSGNASYTMYNTNVENGVLCNNTSTISITLPAKSSYWNNRSYYVKVQTATVNLVQNTGTSIDNDTTTLVMSSDYRGYHLHFDSDYEFNGNIWRLSQI